MEQYLDKAIELGLAFGIRFLTAFVVLIVGLIFAKILRNLVKRLMSKAKVDVTIASFVGNLTYIACVALIVVVVLEQIGIATTSFVVILGAAGLAIGLALQGSLSNFASGFLLVVFRPFKVGDFVEAGGAQGTVEEIALFTTTLNASDNKKIIVPNSKIYNNNIINFTANTTRRIDFVFSISYEDDIDQAKQVFADVIAQESRIKPTPEPKITISEIGERGVCFAVKVWVEGKDYGDVYSDVTEQVKKMLDRKGFSNPYFQNEDYLTSLKMFRKMFF